MNRRDALAGIALLCAVRYARGQSAPKLPRIALVDAAEQTSNMAEGRHALWGPFLSELRKLGYVEGKTITVERWTGGGNTGGYDAMARKIVASRPRLVVARGRSITLPIAAATGEIPIVSVGSISSERRASLARPGKNVTGFIRVPTTSRSTARCWNFCARSRRRMRVSPGWDRESPWMARSARRGARAPG